MIEKRRHPLTAQVREWYLKRKAQHEIGLCNLVGWDGIGWVKEIQNTEKGFKRFFSTTNALEGGYKRGYLKLPENKILNNLNVQIKSYFNTQEAITFRLTS